MEIFVDIGVKSERPNKACMNCEINKKENSDIKVDKHRDKDRYIHFVRINIAGHTNLKIRSNDTITIIKNTIWKTQTILNH